MEIHSCAPQLEYFSWTPALLFSFLMTRVVSSLCSLILLPTLNAACVWFGFSRPEFASWPFSYMLHYELMHSYHVSQFSCCFRLCVCVPWNVCVEVPTLKVMVFQGGALQTFLVFIVLHFRADFVLYKLKVWGNPVSSKSISASFPIAFSHFVSVCRVLVNLTVFQRVFPRWCSGKESPWQCRRCRSDPWVGKIPWRRKWQPIPVFFPGEVHGQRNLVGYSLWGRKEPDMTEHSCPHSVSNFFMIIMLDMIICSQWSLMLLLWLTEASDIG